VTRYQTTLGVFLVGAALLWGAPLRNETQPAAAASTAAASVRDLARIRSLSVAPGNRVIIGTDGAGAYITRDDGRSWMISSIGLDDPQLTYTTFSPTFGKDETVFATSSGHFQRSLNRGHFWQSTALHAPSWALGFRHSYAPRFVGLGRFAPEALVPSTITPSPRFDEDQTLFLGTKRHGVYRSLDGGENLKQVWDAGGAAIVVLEVSPDYAGDKTLFGCLAARGVWRSVDGGANWSSVNRGLPIPAASAPEATATETRTTVLAAIDQLAISPEYSADRTVFAAGGAGLFHSVNRGDDWVPLGDDVLPQGSPIRALAVSPNYKRDSTFLVSTQLKARSPEAPAAPAGNSGSRLFRSRDGGASFERVATPRLPSDEVLHTIRFAATYPESEKIYAASDQAILVGVRRGRRWIPIARPVRVEDTTPNVVYSGAWTKVPRSLKTSAGSVHTSGEGLAEVTFEFVGTGVTWVGSAGPDQGIAKVFLDDEHKKDVDQFAPAFRGVATSYTISGLPRATHSIRIVVLEDKIQSSAGVRIEIDAFDVDL
jgi:hypothetical protein